MDEDVFCGNMSIRWTIHVWRQIPFHINRNEFARQYHFLTWNFGNEFHFQSKCSSWNVWLKCKSFDVNWKFSAECTYFHTMGQCIKFILFWKLWNCDAHGLRKCFVQKIKRFDKTRFKMVNFSFFFFSKSLYLLKST